ncbi:heat shock 70 kDa protein 12A-like [Saccostrea echinata]|uniref:heat shock 70 kDa protein 12A-like n=1 Tax=Saccostrea echinata TaxID=191078 RepID=UPI002A81826B|nr:heat shock 70 kDa protein 12A-like [Saccostrea echinata]
MSNGIVIAIRVGTNFTNCALEENSIEGHVWRGEPLDKSDLADNTEIVTEETPSIVVLSSEKFDHYFGYEALKRIEKQKKGDLIFPEFVKNLFCSGYKVPELLRAENGVPLSSADVMEKVISYLFEQIQSNVEGSTCRQFVFTVPTMATDDAFLFLKHSIVNAGLSEDQVLIIPEAVSILQYCKLHHNTYKSVSGKDVEAFSPGKRSVVLECEDDHMTISVLELKDDGSLEMVYSNYEDVLVSCQVQEEFINMFIKVFGKCVFDDFYSHCRSDYFNLFREFCGNMSKDLHGKEPLIITMPSSFSALVTDKTGKSIEQAIEQTDIAQKMAYTSSKLKIAPEIFQSLFLEAATNTVRLLRKGFQQSGLENIVNIILAGYFSKSTIIQDHIRMSFPSHHLIIPRDGNVAVAKGAVLYGQNPAKYMKARKMDLNESTGVSLC